MARPRSDDKRSAVLAAGVRVFAGQGLSAPTAQIARESGVSNGTLFVYFPTKADLLNQLYVELKAEMGAATLLGMKTGSLREQCASMWTNWLNWSATFPEKRRVLALLEVEAAVTAASRTVGHQAMSPIAQLLDQVRQQGPMRDMPLGFVVGLMTSLADATIDFMIREPARAERFRAEGFEALWRIVS